jgi:hypothetical protein
MLHGTGPLFAASITSLDLLRMAPVCCVTRTNDLYESEHAEFGYIFCTIVADPDQKSFWVVKHTPPMLPATYETDLRMPSRLMLFGRSIGRPSALSQMSCASGPKPRLTPKVAV